MKTLKQIGMLAVLALAASNLGAQIILTPTTLSAALTTSSGQYLTVTTATPNVSTLDNFAVAGSGVTGTALIIENEYMTVTGVSGTTIKVIRGQGGTRAVAHPNGALVWSARPNYLGTKTQNPQGYCVRTTELVLPWVNAQTGEISDCLGGRWVTGHLLEWPPYKVLAPDPGGTAYTSLNTNGTTLAAGDLYCTEMNLRGNKLLTGLAILNGTTVATDKHLVALYDSTGNLLVNSATAGATSATASVYQSYAFVNTASTPAAGTWFAVGPAQYFACFQTNGTTDTVRMIVTGTQDTYLTKLFTGTFGTLAATITVPTTFTTAQGPYILAY